jgi:aspartate/methionine/tyrosine aminotransferase
MHWAKAREGTPWHLGTSGVPAPSPADGSAFLPAELGDAFSSLGDRHGFPDLRRAIAALHGVAEDGVVVSDGTSLANYATLSVLAGPQDRALVETPTYGVLAEIPRFHGAAVERLERRPEDGWCPRLDDLRAALDAPGPPVRAVALTRLHNPTGTDLPAGFLRSLAMLAEERDFHVLFDEVYLDFVDAPPAHRFSPRFLSTGSLTKVYGFGGLRIGWVVGHPEAVRPVAEFSFYLAVNASAPSQLAACRVLARRGELLEGSRQRAARGRAIVERWLASRDDASWVPPAGGLVGFVRLHRVRDTAAFAARLLEEEEVAVAAGEHFGRAGWIRIGFGIDEAPLREALRRLGRALDAAR